jgi:PrgI family protein
MQQHPIPQNVMSVEFQLVGNLTLRQFGYLAAGSMLVFLLFLLPITEYVKYPLMAVAAIFFAILVWIPVNDIGLDRWVVAFFRAINSPTKRVWRRQPKELLYLTTSYSSAPALTQEIAVSNRARLDEYLASLQTRSAKSDLDLAEEAYLTSLPFEPIAPPVPAFANLSLTPALDNIPQEILPPTIPEKRIVEEDLTKAAPLQTTIKPIATVHMPDKNIYVKKVSTATVNRMLRPLTSLEGTILLPVRGEMRFELSDELKKRLGLEPITEESLAAAMETQVPELQPAQTLLPSANSAPQPVYMAPQILPEFVAQPAPAPTAELNVEAQPPVPIAPVPDQNTPEASSAQIEAMEKQLAAEAELTRQRLMGGNQSAAPQLGAGQLAAPSTYQPSGPASPEALQAQLPPVPPPPPLPQVEAVPVEPTPQVAPTPVVPPPIEPALQQPIAATPAVGKMAPPPANVPNVIVGLVRDQSGLLMTEVVIIVKDQTGEPVRALKTNKVGQFAISTPLPNGPYTIELEKDGFQFDIVAVNLNGEIFAPIEIKALPILTRVK